jgi:hypothetical protein
VHLEVDLEPNRPDPAGVAPLERLVGFLKEHRVEEQGDLVLLAAATLHALASRRFRRVDHWEVSPGGWLPPPTGTSDPEASEPVGDLLKSLESGALSTVATARSFSARLSDLAGGRIDVTVRRVHRTRGHALSLDLWGLWTPAKVHDLEGSLAARLPVLHTTITKFQYA